MPQASRNGRREKPDYPTGRDNQISKRQSTTPSHTLSADSSASCSRLACTNGTKTPAIRLAADSDTKDCIDAAEPRACGFWYGCGHCYNLEPVIAEWEKRLPSDVSLVRVPVMWNPTNEIHARVFYSAEALGKRAQISSAMFKAIHIDNKPMTEEPAIQQMFEEFGVSADTFNKTFRSFAVESQLRRARDLTTRYRVKGVPLLVVDGKYLTDGPQIKSHDDLLAVAEELVQRERQAR